VAALAGSLLLAGNEFYREFTDDPATDKYAANEDVFVVAA
jgi:hypothetical protein